MIGVCIPTIFLNKERLEDFRIMCIDDSTVGLFEVVNKVLNHPHLHLEQRPFFIPLHHLEERRGNLGNFLRLDKMQMSRGLARLGVAER